MALVRPGQALSIKWRTAHGQVEQALRQLKLDFRTNGGAEISCWATFVDGAGLSVYIVRGFERGGDMEAFLPSAQIMWQSYFEPLATVNAGYARGGHYRKIFPREFLMR
jgi:hypothetical protein